MVTSRELTSWLPRSSGAGKKIFCILQAESVDREKLGSTELLQGCVLDKRLGRCAGWKREMISLRGWLPFDVY